MIERVKNFKEEHPVLVKTVATVGVLTVGCVVGWKGRAMIQTWKGDLLIGGKSMIGELIREAKTVYPDKWGIYTGNMKAGYTPKQLGKIGEHMIECGVPETKVFTHFIAIGESN